MASNSQQPYLSNSSKNVVITGFGLFRHHETNPSWEAIKDGQLVINRPNLNIITKCINVAYEEVDKVIPALWAEFEPILMVHIGLSALESGIKIEQFARCGPYIHDDVVEYAPHKDLRDYARFGMEENIIQKKYSCKPCDFECKSTCLDIEKICGIVNQAYETNKIVLPVKRSTDAGLYVCEYIYQKSLEINDNCVFIHVPDTKNFDIKDIRDALQLTIEALIDEVMITTRIS